MDQAQFTELFCRYYDTVLGYAVRRTAAHEAADAATEVFLIAWRRRDEVPAKPLPWLIGTARRVLANQRRSDRRGEALVLRIRAEPVNPPIDAADQVETRQRWAAALRRLSAEDQEVIALIAWDGLTGREAARSLNCSESAFLMRLHRARRRLATHLAIGETDRLPTAARPRASERGPLT